MLSSLYIIAHLVQIAAGSCFTAGAWNSVRDLVGDIISTPNLAACQDACLQNNQCAAASYSSASTCALLGEDTGKAFKCSSSGTLYVRDSTCGAVTTATSSTSTSTSTTTSTSSTSTTTLTTSTSTAATTTTLGIDKECSNTCLIQIARESSVDPVMIVDTEPLCMISCPSGSMTARDEDGIWFDVPNNLLACYGVVHHNVPTDLKWCSPTTPYVGYLDPDAWITIVVQCSGSTVVPPLRANTITCPIIADTPSCTTPAFVDPGCNTALHKCTQATRNGDTLECTTGAGGLFITATNKATDPLKCIEGQWWVGDIVYPADTPVYCKTCADVHFGNAPGYNPDNVLPVRSADGLTYTCAAPYGVWMAYRPADTPDIYYMRRTTAFQCVAPDYLWNTPGVDQGPQPTSMIADWVGRGEAYDVGCSNNAKFGWGNCPLPKWVDPACDARFHTCSEVTVNGNYLKCPTGAGVIVTATNQVPSCMWVCGSGGQWTACSSPVAPATAVYCKACADPQINWNSYTGDGVVPERSADGLSYICPAPYTEVWMTYVPAGGMPAGAPQDWFTRRTTRFTCFTSSGYYWNSPGLDNGPQPNWMIKDFVENGYTYNIGCTTSAQAGFPP